MGQDQLELFTPRRLVDHGLDRVQHNLVDAPVADESLCAKEVVVSQRDPERECLDGPRLRGHVATMVLPVAPNGQVSGVKGDVCADYKEVNSYLTPWYQGSPRMPSN